MSIQPNQLTSSCQDSQKFFYVIGKILKLKMDFFTDKSYTSHNSWFYHQNLIHLCTICPCVKKKRPHILQSAEMQSIFPNEPLQIVSMDFLHSDKSSVGYEYLLVVTDLFTKFTQVYATRNKEGKTAADRFYNDFILKFGLPGTILHDQGKEFDNHLFRQLSQLCSIKEGHEKM